MSTRIKVVILGGSALATPKVFQEMGEQGARSAYNFVLVGRDPERLELVKKVSDVLVSKFPDLDIAISISSETENALEGADYVINQIRVGGLEGRAFDESFPRQFGIPGEETVGPGGFSSSVRGIPVVLQFCRMIEKVAPDAVMLNLTNPSSIIQYAIQYFTGVKVIGTCDAPVSLMEMTARVLGFPVADLKFDLAGMHHFSWITGIEHQKDALLPMALSRLEQMPKLGTDPNLVRALGALPSSYFKYYAHPDRILAATEGRTLRAHEIMGLSDQILDEYRRWQPGDPTGMLDRRGAVWYKKIVIPALLALAEKQNTQLVLSIENQGCLSWLPAKAIIEVPVPIQNGQLLPPRKTELPADIQAMIMQNAAYEMLAAEAIGENNRDKAVRALSANLLISNFNQVQGILSLVWPGEKKAQFNLFLPGGKQEGEQKLVIPTLHFGEKLVEQINPPEDSFALITMQELWPLVKDRFNRKPDAVLFMSDLDWYELDAMERALPEVGAVIGLGGGMAQDAAKFVGWKRHIPVDEIVSITSVDASVTKSIAARAGGNVTYIGYKVPRHVYIDYGLVRGAPARLNRAGVGDILCAHTALWDWKLSHTNTGEAYDPEAVTAMQRWLENVVDQADEILQVTNQGIRLTMEAFEDISIICRRFGSSRPQEGSDHAFAYNAEFQTGKKFLHGELVALGAYILAHLQDNEPEYLADIYQKTGILWQPRDIGMSVEAFFKTMESLNWYQSNFGRRYTVLNERKIEPEFIQQMQNRLQF